MFSSARAVAAAGAAALALAAAAPAAHAEVRYVYDAWFGAGVGYATDEASESGKVTRRTSAKLVATGWLEDLRFVDGKLLTQRVAKGTLIRDAEAQLHFVNNDVDPPDTADCVDRAPRLGFAGLLNPLRAFDPRAAPTAMGFSPFSQVTFDLNCDVGGTLLGLGAVSHRPGDLGPGHLRVELVVPRDRLGDQEIALRAQRTWTARPSCPGDFVESDLRSCRTGLNVNMILYRTYADPDPDDDLLAPLAVKRPTVDRGARRTRAQVRCPSGCRYRIRIFKQPRNGRGVLGRALPVRAAAAAAPAASAAAAAAIASRAGRLPAGRAARTVAVSIPASQRAGLVEDGSALVTIELDPPRGETVRATYRVPVSG